jgi:serine protease inhibitor
MYSQVAKGNASLEGRNFKLTPQGVAAGISSTTEIGRLSSKNEFRNRQRVASIPGSRTYLDNQSKDFSKKDCLSLSSSTSDLVTINFLWFSVNFTLIRMRSK